MRHDRDAKGHADTERHDNAERGLPPSSPAVVQIVSPTNDEVVSGSTVHVVVALQNATVVQ